MGSFNETGPLESGNIYDVYTSARTGKIQVPRLREIARGRESEREKEREREREVPHRR